MPALVLTNVTQAVTALQVAVKAASPLSTASLSRLAPVAALAQAANTLTDQAITATDLLIPTSGPYGITGGGFALTLMAQLLAVQNALQDMNALMTVKASVGRIAFNFSIAPG